MGNCFIKWGKKHVSGGGGSGRAWGAKKKTPTNLGGSAGGRGGGTGFFCIGFLPTNTWALLESPGGGGGGGPPFPATTLNPLTYGNWGGTFGELGGQEKGSGGKGWHPKNRFSGGEGRNGWGLGNGDPLWFVGRLGAPGGRLFFRPVLGPVHIFLAGGTGDGEGGAGGAAPRVSFFGLSLSYYRAGKRGERGTKKKKGGARGSREKQRGEEKEKEKGGGNNPRQKKHWGVGRGGREGGGGGGGGETFIPLLRSYFPTGDGFFLRLKKKTGGGRGGFFRLASHFQGPGGGGWGDRAPDALAHGGFGKGGLNSRGGKGPRPGFSL